MRVLINILMRSGYIGAMNIPFVMLIFTILSLWILAYLVARSIQSGKKLKVVTQNANITPKAIDLQIIEQKITFHLWLTLLKSLAILQPILFIIWIFWQFARSFDAWAMVGTVDLVLLCSGLSEFFLFLTTGISMVVFPLLLHFIFSYILQRRILHLEKLKLEIL